MLISECLSWCRIAERWYVQKSIQRLMICLCFPRCLWVKVSCWTLFLRSPALCIRSCRCKTQAKPQYSIQPESQSSNMHPVLGGCNCQMQRSPFVVVLIDLTIYLCNRDFATFTRPSVKPISQHMTALRSSRDIRFQNREICIEWHLVLKSKYNIDRALLRCL